MMPSSQGKRKWTPDDALREVRRGCALTGRQLASGLSSVGDAVKRFMVEESHKDLCDQTCLAFPRMVAYGNRFASIVFKKNAAKLSKEDAEKVRLEFLSLPEKEQKKLVEQAKAMWAEDAKVKFKGRTVNLKKLLQKQESKRLYTERGGGINTMNEVEENKKRIEKMDGKSLFPNSVRTELSPEEAAKLNGARMAEGTVSKGFWGGRLFCYGLYAQDKVIQDALGKKWAGKDPNEVAQSGEFYLDILRRSPQLGLTLLVMPTKKISLPQMQREYKQRLKRTLQDMKATESDMEDLDKLINLFDKERLRGRAKWVSGSRIVPNTMLYFSTTSGGEVLIEVTTPGPVRKQVTSVLGKTSSQLLTAAIFCEVLGEKPLDPAAKLQAAHSLLYFANGFNSDPDSQNANQFSPNAPPSFKVVTAEIRPNMFNLDQAPDGKFILGGVKRYRKKEHEAAVERLELASAG